MSELHVILGAGQIGPRIAARLLARGHRVRMVRRSSVSNSTNGIECVSADLTDPNAAEVVMRGATTVYHCVTPVYTDWHQLLLPLTKGVVEGAARANTHLVALDNLYMYGRAGTMREDTPVAPVSKKGELRAQAAQLMIDARKHTPVTIARASDFFGPNAPLAAIFGERFYQRVYAGKAAEVLGDPDMPHSYSFVDDIADGLVTLGTDARAKNQLWHLPVNSAESTRATIARAGKALGMNLAVTSVPTWVLQGMGIFVPVMREIAEMTYQWKLPFVLDDSKFRSTFGQAPTPWDEAWQITAQWAQRTYAAKKAA